MKKLALVLFVFSLFVVSCQHKDMEARLENIDTLIHRGDLDSANSYIENIDASKLDPCCYSYYGLLKSICDYRLLAKMTSDTLLNKSIEYYEQHADLHHLIEAYICKGQIESEKGNHEQAVSFLKKAENLLDYVKSSELFIRTKACLAHENVCSGNFHVALSYCKLALSEAQKTDNKRWLAFCNNQMCSIFSHSNMADSSMIYQSRAMLYVDYAPKIEQATIYLNYGIEKWRKGSLDTAENYIKKSLELYPDTFSYATLAELYAQQGKTENANKLWNYAFDIRDYSDKLHFMNSYAYWLRQQGRDDEAWEIMKRLPAMRDSLYQKQNAESILYIQNQYDKEWATLRLQRMLAYAVGGIVALLLLGIVVWMYLRWKAQRTKRELAEKQLLIVDYSQQIERLSKEGKENSAEMRQLEKQLDRVRSDVQSMIYNGKRLMEHVKAGGNTAVWKKKDFENVIEYYRTVNLPFVMHLEKDYRSLTPSNMFMLLLAEELKYNDGKIEECMLMSPGALRTAKSRINSRHLGQGKD